MPVCCSKVLRLVRSCSWCFLLAHHRSPPFRTHSVYAHLHLDVINSRNFVSVLFASYQTIEIIGDTFRFLLLILGSLLGFSWSFYALFKRGPQEEASNGLEEGCAVLRSNDGFGVFGAALFLFEILLGSDNQLDCLRASPHASLAAGIMDICELGSTRKSTNPSLPLHSMADLGYDTLECLRPHSYHYEKRVCATSCLTVLVVFLLLGSNMLIALMAKTVDRVYVRAITSRCCM